LEANDYQEIEMTGLNRSRKLIAIIIAVSALVACSSRTPREKPQWQPTNVTDFKSVAGTWEGLMVRNPRVSGDDWVRLVIRDTGAYEFASPRLIGVFSGKGNLVLTDGKMSAKSDKGGQITLQLYTDFESSERMLKADGKDSGGFTYAAELKRPPSK
jgi:hypothetical protein